MKKYLFAAALILCAPQPLLAQAEVFYLMVDNIRLSNAGSCPVQRTNFETNKARYKELGKYASMDEANAALNSMLGGACPKL